MTKSAWKSGDTALFQVNTHDSYQRVISYQQRTASPSVFDKSGKMRTLLLLAAFLAHAFSYKVLIFNPAFGASHSNFLGKIADILIDAGNDVVSWDQAELPFDLVLSDNVHPSFYELQKRPRWL